MSKKMADQSEADFKVMVIMSYNRHLREIDCSLAIVGGLATAYSQGVETRGKSIYWPHIQCQSVFYGSWQQNFYCLERQAGWPMSVVYFF